MFYIFFFLYSSSLTSYVFSVNENSIEETLDEKSFLCFDCFLFPFQKTIDVNWTSNRLIKSSKK